MQGIGKGAPGSGDRASILVLAGGISSCTNMVIGGLGAVTATSYPSEEQDMKEVEAAYTAMEQDLQYELDNYESLNPGYDEYRFDLDGIHHDPHELAAYLSAYFGGAYTRRLHKATQTVFELQYELTRNGNGGNPLPHRNKDGHLDG